MKEIDVRFSAEEMGMFKSMTGKTMQKYKCDPFDFSTSVYGIVGILVDNKGYSFTNLIEVADYFGQEEDVAMFKFQSAEYDKICSMIENQTLEESPIKSTISQIRIVNEHQELYKKDIKIYDVWLTRGIIFKLGDGREVSFEKEIWFSETINVNKGHDLIKKFSPVSEFMESWSGDYHGECSREIVIIE
ncbi:MAG: hypothetical protein K6C05_02495 [Anaerovibrio sp.]|uniref:hypothetical protein n=1 Tax=Anaerovibrio sp. TaxID=1872532 RepID=UPI0025FE1E50|nr:hypothetical protein [Anaerovibrio sp.]MCR5175699.1 hypothetical protein [Anaerovibrio sp.]